MRKRAAAGELTGFGRGKRSHAAPYRPAWRARLWLIACSLCAVSAAASQSRPKPIVRDSSGVRIVEYQTIKTTAPAFSVGATPLATVGGLRDDPADEIDSKTGIASAVRLGDGRIAVVEWWGVRILNPAGRLVRTLGGRGGGPGLFNAQVTGVCRMRGDSLVVTSSDRRISVFDSAGKHVRSVTADGAVVSNCADDGTFVAKKPVSAEQFKAVPAEDAASAPVRTSLFRLTRDGRLGDSLGVFEGMIGISRLLAAVWDRFIVRIQGSMILADNGSKAEIKAYSQTGKLARVIRWHDPLVPLTPGLLAELSDARLPRDAPPGERAARRAQVMAVKQRPFLPAYTELFVDRVGRLWLRDYWPVVRGSTYNPGYTVFSPEGLLLGRFEVPASRSTVNVTDASADYVLVLMASMNEGATVIVRSIVPAR